MPSWCGAQLKKIQGQLYLYLNGKSNQLLWSNLQHAKISLLSPSLISAEIAKYMAKSQHRNAGQNHNLLVLVNPLKMWQSSNNWE
jgi:hypothetical protein